MEFLLIEIIRRLDEISANGNEAFEERKSVALDPVKHIDSNEKMEKEEKKKKCCY